MQHNKYRLVHQLSSTLGVKLAVIPYAKLLTTIIKVQASFKMFIARKKYLKVRALISLLQAVSKKKSALRNLKELQYGIVKKLERLHPVLPRSISSHLLYDMPLPPLPQYNSSKSNEEATFIKEQLEQHEDTILDQYTDWVKSMPEIRLSNLSSVPNRKRSSSKSEDIPKKVVTISEKEPLVPPRSKALPPRGDILVKKEPQQNYTLSPIAGYRTGTPDTNRRASLGYFIKIVVV